MNPLRYIRMVLWSFFGIRRGAGAAEELAQARPVPLVLTAVALAALIVGTLASLAWIATRVAAS
jgi:amino acid transporter